MKINNEELAAKLDDLYHVVFDCNRDRIHFLFDTEMGDNIYKKDIFRVLADVRLTESRLTEIRKLAHECLELMIKEKEKASETGHADC